MAAHRVESCLQAQRLCMRLRVATLRTGRTPFSVSGSPKAPTSVLDDPNNHSSATLIRSRFALSYGSPTLGLQPFRESFKLSIGCALPKFAVGQR